MVKNPISDRFLRLDDFIRDRIYMYKSLLCASYEKVHASVPHVL